MKIVYLAGKISSDPDYRHKFQAAADELTQAGFVVVNPAVLPDGMSYHAYMRITTAMLDECEGVFFLPGWFESPGAKHEFNRAQICGLKMFYFDEWKRDNRVKQWLNS